MAEVTLFGAAAPGTSRLWIAMSDIDRVVAGVSVDVTEPVDILGVRLFAASSAIGLAVTLGVFVPGVALGVGMVGTPTRSGPVTLVAGWNEVRFGSPVRVSSGRILLTADHATGGYLSVSGLSSAAIPATGLGVAMAPVATTAGAIPPGRALQAAHDIYEGWIYDSFAAPGALDLIAQAAPAGPTGVAATLPAPTVTLTASVADVPASSTAPVLGHVTASVASILGADGELVGVASGTLLVESTRAVRFPVDGVTVPRARLECPVIDGVLYPPGTTSPAGATPGVEVLASEQPAGQPDRVQYRATWRLDGVLNPAPVLFEVPAGGVVDLAWVAPTELAPGVERVVSDEAAVRAEAAVAQVAALRPVRKVNGQLPDESGAVTVSAAVTTRVERIDITIPGAITAGTEVAGRVLPAGRLVRWAVRVGSGLGTLWCWVTLGWRPVFAPVYVLSQVGAGSVLSQAVVEGEALGIDVDNVTGSPTDLTLTVWMEVPA